MAIRQRIRRYLMDPLRRWYFGAPPQDDAACPIYLPGEESGRRRTDGDGEADAALLAAESAYIHQRKGGGSRSYRIGLALSGGGIRSATFSLGVMQRLARAGILGQIDYLSTVSGGGYIGSGLSWWLSGKSGSPHRYGLGQDDFPYGTDDPGAHTGDPEILSQLRQSGRYLVPGNGITIWSAAAVVLRAILLNLVVWIPAFATVFLLLLNLKRPQPFHAELDIERILSYQLGIHDGQVSLALAGLVEVDCA